MSEESTSRATWNTTQRDIYNYCTVVRLHWWMVLLCEIFMAIGFFIGRAIP